MQHPDTFKSTFIQKETTIASAMMERLDYILIDSSLTQFVQTSKILPAFASDHAMPVVYFQFSVTPPGPGYWKLNIKLLDDEKFVTEVLKRMTDVLSDISLDIMERWELLKFSVKEQS